MDPNTEQLLRDYVQRQNTEAAEGYSTRNLATSIKNVADGLAAHVKECTEHRESQSMKVASIHARLESIEAGTAKTISPPPLPPMRSREDSSHDLKEFADAVAREALEASRSPNPSDTPEARVEKVVDETLKKRDAERELAAFRAGEASRQKAANDRRSLMGQLFLAAVSGGGVFEIVKALLHHQ